ncbi:MAG: DUF4123 domain-containing protein [Treponema sp.]|jgi:hypothetical protein|nr:DUF4123 domain-containing protein [Treponema sp.]
MDFANICSLAFATSSINAQAAYLLIDGSAQNGKLLAEIYKIAPPDVIYSLFKGTKYEENLLEGPHLIPVQYDSSLLTWYRQEGRDAGMLLFSSYAPIMIVGHLQQYLTCILPDDRHKMLRFYDPFIFYYVWNSLTTKEKSLFLGPIHTVVCVRPIQEKKDEHIFFLTSDRAEYIQPTSAKRFPWFISEATYKALNAPSQYSLARILAKEFLLLYPRTGRIVGKARVFAFSEKVVQINEAIGLTTKNELLVLMGIAAQLGTGFFTDPQYATVAGGTDKISSPQEQLYAMSQEVERIKEQAWYKGGKPYYSALKRIYNKSYEEISRQNTLREVVDGLREVYPERVQQIGEEAMLEIAELGMRKSKEWGLVPRPGIAISSGILFFLGTGCEQDPLRPWIGDFVKKQMPAEEKTQELFKTFRRILRFNFRNRQLEPEQEQALWLHRFLEPFHRVNIAAQIPRQAESLTAALVALQPMLAHEDAVYWREQAEKIARNEPFQILPLPVQTLLALMLMLEKVPWADDEMDTTRLLELCRSNQPQRAIALLDDRLSWLVRHITMKLQAEFGGDIL